MRLFAVFLWLVGSVHAGLTDELLLHRSSGSGPSIFICLGHQLLALAAGARTEKMKFGHHGANHPVQDLASGAVMIWAGVGSMRRRRWVRPIMLFISGTWLIVGLFVLLLVLWVLDDLLLVAGGDIVRGPALVVNAVQDGKVAARAIMEYLNDNSKKS